MSEPEGNNAGQLYGPTNCARCGKLTNDFYFLHRDYVACPDCLTTAEWRSMAEAARTAAFSFRQAANYAPGTDLWAHWHPQGEAALKAMSLSQHGYDPGAIREQLTRKPREESRNARQEWHSDGCAAQGECTPDCVAQDATSEGDENA
jgi:hypothetical protein